MNAIGGIRSVPYFILLSGTVYHIGLYNYVYSRFRLYVTQDFVYPSIHISFIQIRCFSSMPHPPFYSSIKIEYRRAKIHRRNYKST